ncbi:AlpA family phage regulatory protein [Achromobacter xylosoxidans]|uniref:helix-turn-helix transcriptional regulator n=1 Tax=Alcaligenes xylosoxydans xylosoxydans TaxID=85698 RepID=UPI001F054BBA|nr:AlpA family phage regulatory protein [Achromobacter xylosoxidans]MCH1988675.1 AlpA family phage regulatory protein [Achromobacter xylosoxidans]MCH1993893.1 AlpA family phage regulatory protein [Achromobacter xylosoxidans]MCH4587786.1 AlpA family phage regulatory protein [Achromobacter xylosoxidans]
MREQGESLLPLKVVQSRVGMGKTKIYEQIKAGAFPACIKNGRTSVWIASEVDSWILQTIREKRSST